MIIAIWRWLFPSQVSVAPKYPEIDVIISSLDNEPDKWSAAMVGDLVGPLQIRLDNALDYKSLGLKAFRGGVPISVPVGCGLRSAVDRWDNRRREIAARRLVQDDHTARVGRIMEMKEALTREEQRHIQGLLSRPQ